MALAGVLAAALTDHSAHPKSLLIAGLDVIRPLGSAGNGYGVEIETISLTEAGPGSTSALEFVIEDPGSVITVNVGDLVQLNDNVANVPLFLGFATTPAFRVREGNQGRDIVVSCIGIEVLLDWSYWPGGTVGVTDSTLTSIVQEIASLSIQAAPGLRAFQVANGLGPSTQATPIGQLPSALPSAVIPAGSMRSAIAAAIALRNESFSVTNPQDIQVTVDFWGGLRAWATPYTALPTDFTSLAVAEAGPIRSSELDHTLDGASVIRQVIVTGGNAAGSGTFGDGSGIPGQVGSVSDAAILTKDAAMSAALGVLLANRIVARGSLKVEDWAPTVGIHGGSTLSITDTATGATGSYTISGLQKTFNPNGREDWTVSYGGLPPSFVDSVGR